MVREAAGLPEVASEASTSPSPSGRGPGVVLGQRLPQVSCCWLSLLWVGLFCLACPPDVPPSPGEGRSSELSFGPRERLLTFLSLSEKFQS